MVSLAPTFAPAPPPRVVSELIEVSLFEVSESEPSTSEAAQIDAPTPPAQNSRSATEPCEAAALDLTSGDRLALVSAIMKFNDTVTREYLEQFRVESLRNYLEHLRVSAEPRRRQAGWVRLADTPGLILIDSED